jgi:hypothetical protein
MGQTGIRKFLNIVLRVQGGEKVNITSKPSVSPVKVKVKLSP